MRLSALPSTALALGRAVGRTYGPRGLWERAWYEVAWRSGLLRWREGHHRPGHRPGPLTFDAALNVAGVREWVARQPRAEAMRSHATAVAERLVAGHYALFGGEERDIDWTPQWHRHPSGGFIWPTDIHWTQLADASAEQGDIRDLWELSRLSVIGPLARAWALTGSDRWAAEFWRCVGDWIVENPAFLGPAWMSGQEVALRGISVLFGLAAFGTSSSPSADALSAVGAFLRDSERRVKATLGYASSQRNNHVISEASFLFSLAALVPSLPNRDRTLGRARRVLLRSVRDQFGPDGSYAQNSFSYQRLAMHGLLWSAWAGRQGGVDLGPEIDRAVTDSYRLVGSSLDRVTGRLPNFGSVDSSLLFRLTGCDLADFRPALVHAALATGTAPPVEAGSWDEEAVWFGHHRSPGRDAHLPSVASGTTAYQVLRGPTSHAFLHAGKHRHRPGHADQLHLDLWISAVNVARDPGTFRYTGQDQWRNAFTGEEVHNRPRTTHGAGARRLGRFFWLDWPEATVLVRVRGGDHEVVIAELAPGSGKTIIRRLVARVGDTWIVGDLVQPPAGGVVRWNLPPETVVQSTGRTSKAVGLAFVAEFHGGSRGAGLLVPREDDPTSGWESTTYGERSSLVALEVPVDQSGVAVASFAGVGAKVAEPDHDAIFQALTTPSESAALRATGTLDPKQVRSRVSSPEQSGRQGG